MCAPRRGGGAVGLGLEFESGAGCSMVEGMTGTPCLSSGEVEGGRGSGLARRMGRLLGRCAATKMGRKEERERERKRKGFLLFKRDSNK